MKLVVVLVRYSGDAANTTGTKVNLLNKVLQQHYTCNTHTHKYTVHLRMYMYICISSISITFHRFWPQWPMYSYTIMRTDQLISTNWLTTGIEHTLTQHCYMISTSL